MKTAFYIIRTKVMGLSVIKSFQCNGHFIYFIFLSFYDFQNRELASFFIPNVFKIQGVVVRLHIVCLK